MTMHPAYQVLNKIYERFLVYGVIYSLKLHTKFSDRLWNFKSMSQTDTKLSAMGLLTSMKINLIPSSLILFRSFRTGHVPNSSDQLLAKCLIIWISREEFKTKPKLVTMWDILIIVKSIGNNQFVFHHFVTLYAFTANVN